MSSINEAKRVFATQARALKEIEKSITDSFDEAIEILDNSKLIITTGVGKSGFIARKIAATLTSYGIKAIFLDPIEAMHGDLGIAEKGSSAILISKSGTTTELLNLLPFIKNRDIATLAITAGADSPLAKQSDVLLHTPISEESCPIGLAPTSSTTAALVTGDALSSALVIKKGIRQRDFAANHPSGQLGRNNLLKVSDVMKKQDKIPKINHGENLKNAIIEISNKGLGCVCIMENDNLFGILTDGDIRRSLQKGLDIQKTLVDEVMTKDPVKVKDSDLLGTALSLMENRKSKIGMLPVVNQYSNLVGIIQIHDVFGSETN